MCPIRLHFGFRSLYYMRTWTHRGRSFGTKALGSVALRLIWVFRVVVCLCELLVMFIKVPGRAWGVGFRSRVEQLLILSACPSPEILKHIIS